MDGLQSFWYNGNAMEGKSLDAQRIADVLGVPRTTFSRWCQTGVLRVPGGGTVPYRFDGASVFRAFVVKALRSQGATMAAIRAALRALHEREAIEDFEHEWLHVAPNGATFWSHEKISVEPDSGELWSVDIVALKARVKAALSSIEEISHADCQVAGVGNNKRTKTPRCSGSAMARAAVSTGRSK